MVDARQVAEVSDESDNDNNEIDQTVGQIDLNLDHSEAAAEFAEDYTQNIWNQPADDEDAMDTPSFLRRLRKKKHQEKDK